MAIGKMNKRILIEELDIYTIDLSGGYPETWIPFYSILDTTEVGTTTTNIKMTAHGMETGDYIINTSRSNAVRIITKVDINNITVISITGQTSGDIISKRSKINSTIWSNMKPSFSGSMTYNNHIQDTNNETILFRYQTLLSSSKYRCKLYPELTRIFEFSNYRILDEKNKYIEVKAREILL